MKKEIAKGIVICLLFIFSYQSIQYFTVQNGKKRVNASIELSSSKTIKKVNYADGEYEKERKKWKKELNDLYEKVLKNMNLSLEHFVVQNFIQYENEFTDIWMELIKIEPTNKYGIIHENIIMEAKSGAVLSDAYINHIKLFENELKNYLYYHYKNNR